MLILIRRCWFDATKLLLCVCVCWWIQLDLIWPHTNLKGNSGLGNFHVSSIDYGSCGDIEKSIPLLPFIDPIKYLFYLYREKSLQWAKGAALGKTWYHYYLTQTKVTFKKKIFFTFPINGNSTNQKKLVIFYVHFIVCMSINNLTNS